MEQALEERRLLLTEDKDFGELVYRLRRPAHGVILMRFAEDEQDAKVSRLRLLLRTETERLAGYFVVLEADKIRIRPLR